MIGIFFKSMLIGYSGAIMPGSLLTYTVDKSLKSGSKAGLIISLGHAMLELVLVVLLFLGAGRYLGTTNSQIIIGIAGGIFLIYSGFAMIKDVISENIKIDLNSESNSKQGNLILGGALISASNPYLFVWWTAVGLGLIMNAYSMFGIIGIILFYFGHIMADITWYVFVSTLISKTRNFISLKLYRILVAFLGACLIIFGAGFIFSSWNLISLNMQLLQHLYYF